jgi:hypothetical protein
MHPSVHPVFNFHLIYKKLKTFTLTQVKLEQWKKQMCFSGREKGDKKKRGKIYWA